MNSKITHNNGIYTEFEWCYGNFKDWFLEKKDKIDKSKLTTLFRSVDCFLIYETTKSKFTNRSEPILKIHRGRFYEELKGVRIKVVSELPITLHNIDIKRNDTDDYFEDGFDKGYIQNNPCNSIELYGQFMEKNYKLGHRNTRTFYIPDFSIIHKE